MSANEHSEDRFETPALIRPEHIVVNPDAPAKWQRYEIADDTPLGRAKRAGKLDAGGRRGYTGEDRYQAGLRFRAIWDTVHSTGCASKFERIGGGSDLCSYPRVHGLGFQSHWPNVNVRRARGRISHGHSACNFEFFDS